MRNYAFIAMAAMLTACSTGSKNEWCSLTDSGL